ncbi:MULTISPECIES: cytidine deaminase [unclassified Desulfurobacterium]|uniref:cytidine deaminase n=1 Tax=unclassified Desulfurobacterium TaxID=2639089 RepID=UPI0003B6C4E1|nr:MULTISPECIES: cytidine deaminase [unclassified Desulfurobacterium]
MKVEELLGVAKENIKNCYAPYSNFRVVAAIETKEGKVYTGVNVENASYGLTMCAERVALFKAVSEGVRDFLKILIYSPDGMPYPCGACRQVLSEFCNRDFLVVVASDERIEKFTLGGLLPHSFSL